jgi:hypothetical protein
MTAKQVHFRAAAREKVLRGAECQRPYHPERKSCESAS